MLADTVASFVNSHRGSLTNELQQSAIHQRWSCPHFAMDPDVSAWFRPGSNRGPFACEANVITTTLRNRCALAARYVVRERGRLMELHELVRRARLEPLETIDEADGHVEVIDITHDSRRIAPGAMFAAVPGTRFDGHDHAPDAVDRGASAVLVERPLRLGVPDVVVGDVRRDMGRAAAAVWGHPADLMTTVGVTGTAGKTTTTHLVAGVLEAAGARPEVIGTISGALTTPESTDLHRQLAEARLQGRDAVAMEVSSPVTKPVVSASRPDLMISR